MQYVVLTLWLYCHTNNTSGLCRARKQNAPLKQCREHWLLPNAQTEVTGEQKRGPFSPLDELSVVQVFLVPFGISIVINNTDAFLCSLPQESCRKCHVVWKEHAGKTCEQVMERDEIRLRVAL